MCNRAVRKSKNEDKSEQLCLFDINAENVFNQKNKQMFFNF